jgi:hypothetical protein
MYKRITFLALSCFSLLSLMLSNQFITSANSYVSLTSQELEIIRLVNGTNAYNYDLELEKIALNHSISDYAFRSAGSPGANETAIWIKKQFESFGIDTHIESFEFTNWNLISQPILVIDDDGNASTTDDQRVIGSFQSTHYSWPTPKGGVFSDLVILPLPDKPTKPYNATAWNAINTTGKILLIGKEVFWDKCLHLAYRNKLIAQPPVAVIYTWWYESMSSIPPMFSSAGGLPGSDLGPYYWDLGIPVGWVNYNDGLWIRNAESSMNVSAHVTIQAVIGSGPHYNIVGKIQGSINPERAIIISGHYDTVMCPGFCDNGAGTAGVLELARVFAKAVKEGLYNPGYTLLFVAFASEEIGLVGSINYVKQHEAELKSIGAVINLDSIGSDILEVSETSQTDGLDLDEVVLRAAGNLGVEARLTESGGSDQETFRDPKEANNIYFRFWGFDAGISNATPVKASTALYSYPLFYSEISAEGTPGWAHTPYDNSTSTITLNWVEVDHLEGHIQVAALSTMRFLSYIYNPFLLQVASVAIVASIVAAVAIYFERSRVSIFLKAMYERGRDIVFFIEFKGFLYVIILAVLFLFVSFTASNSVGKIEFIINGFPRMITVFFWGFPLRMAGTLNPVGSAETGWVEEYQGSSIIIFWDQLILDIILYFLLAFGLTYLILRLKYKMHLRHA